MFRVVIWFWESERMLITLANVKFKLGYLKKKKKKKGP